MKDTRYGFGENPPYSLYQATDGKWGLINGPGIKLEAVFKRGGSDSNSFSCVPWDFAELLQGEEVRLVQVAALIRTSNECWNIYKNSPNEYSMDYRADSYGILVDDAGSLEFALATALMKPRFCIPTDIFNTINARFDIMMMSAIKDQNPTVKAFRVENNQ